MRQTFSFLAASMAVAIAASQSSALTLNPVLRNISLASPYSGGPITSVPATFNNNNVRSFRINGTANGAAGNGGGGFTLAFSNGENGVNGTGVGPGLNNDDVANPEPVGVSIAAVNSGGRVQNGNAFRFSVWMQLDPNDPVTKELGVEPVLKFELWREARSLNQDLDGSQLAPRFGDKMWDTDVNARNSYFTPYNQSTSSFVDINGNGTLANGFTPAASLPAVSPPNGEHWTRVETTIVIDDHPDDNPNFGWQIGEVGVGTGPQQYYVNDLEEIRAVFFMGNFDGNSAALANGGKVFVDNALVEVFHSEADMLATPNPNPIPVGYAGDLDQDNDVDGDDVLAWQRGVGFFYNASTLTTIRSNFGGGGGMNTAVISYAATATPEPGAGLSALAACLGGILVKRRGSLC